MPAPTITGTSNARSAGSVASLTVSHTSNATDPLFAIALIFNSAQIAVGTCTFDGAAMTLAYHGQNGSYNFYVFVLPPPGAKTADIVYTPLSNFFIAIGGYNAKDAALAIRALLTNGVDTLPTNSSVAYTDELLLDLVATDFINNTYTADGGQSSLFEQEDATNNIKIASSTKSGTGSVTLGWTLNSADNWAQILLVLVPASSGGNGGSVSSAVLRGVNSIPYKSNYY